MRSALFVLPLPLFLAACGQQAATNDGQANATQGQAAPATAKSGAAPASNGSTGTDRDEVSRTETVTGIFAGWEMGDYLWGQVRIPGRGTISAQPAPSPVDLFLDANRGKTLSFDIATVRTFIPEAGQAIEIQRITGARDGAMTPESWWAGLSSAERQAAQRRFEEGALSSGAR